MSTITRTRNSSKRIAFQWSIKNRGVLVPLNLGGCTIEMLIDTEQVESTPTLPVRVATITGVVSSATNGQAYFPITSALTSTIQSLYFEVWLTDGNGETYPIDSGQINVVGGMK
jgi:hypothetical protein